jgi:very-short-patch-repair endonuclease
MRFCENCNKEHNGDYGSGRFCSSKCARSFSTKQNRSDISKKVSITLKNKSVSKNIIKECIICKKIFERKWVKRNQKFCSISCSSKQKMKERWLDESYREKMIQRSIDRHKNNELYYGWQSRKKMEMYYPEKIAKLQLDNYNIKYEREYKIDRYFIDFALLEYKIAIEIDGQQHKLKERILSDIKKDDVLIKNGWVVIRIKYPEENIKNRIIEIMNNIMASARAS